MTIINMAGGGGNNINVPLNGISNLTASSGDGQAVIKRTDVGDLVVNGVTVNEWSCTKLVRKTGSAPASSNDGTPVLTETLENSYSVTGYTNTGLTNDTTYYYGAFSVGTNGLETISNIATVTPIASGWQPGADTVAYYPLEIDTNDYSGNNRNALSTSGNLTFTTSTDGYECANFPGNTYIEYGTQWNQINYGTTGCTIALWLGDIGDNSGTYYDTNGILSGHVASDNNIFIGLASSNNVGGTGNLMFVCKNQVQAVTNSSLYNTNGMHLYTFTTSTDGTMKYYKDGALVATYSLNFSSSPSWDDCKIGWNNRDTRQRRYYIGKMRQVVFETKTWTADDVLLYYNTTK